MQLKYSLSLQVDCIWWS